MSIPPPEPDLTQEQIVKRAEDMVAVLRERQEECEELGRLPDQTSTDADHVHRRARHVQHRENPIYVAGGLFSLLYSEITAVAVGTVKGAPRPLRGDAQDGEDNVAALDSDDRRLERHEDGCDDGPLLA